MRTIDWKTLTFRDYWHLLRRRKWLIITPLLLATVCAILVAQITPPVYSTKVTMIAEEVKSGSILQGIVRIPLLDRERLTVIRQRLLIRPLLIKVAESLQLRHYLMREGIDIADTGILSALKKNWRKLARRLHLEKSNTEWTDRQIVDYLRSTISVGMRANIIEISVMHSDPQLTMDIANQLASTYVDDVKRRRLDEVRDTFDFIQNQLLNYKGKVAESEKALRDAREAGLLDSLTNANIGLVDQYTKAEADLIAIQMSIENKQQEIRQLKLQLQTGIGDLQVQRLRNRAENLQAHLDQLKTTYSDSWHEVISTQNKLKIAQLELKQEEQTRQAQIKPQLDKLQKELDGLNVAKIETTLKRNKYQEALQQFPSEPSSLSHLLSEKQQNQERYAFLFENLDEANFLIATELRQMGKVAEVLDPAILPEKPIKPNKTMIIAAGIVVGLGIGLGLLLLLEYFDHSIHSIEEAEKFFEGIPILGVIPNMKTKH